MRVLKSEKPKRSFLLRVAVAALAVYAVLALVNQQVQISTKAQELENIEQQLQMQELKNNDAKHALEAGDDQSNDYIERMAREEFDYVKPGERVFENIQGN